MTIAWDDAAAPTQAPKGVTWDDEAAPKPAAPNIKWDDAPAAIKWDDEPKPATAPTTTTPDDKNLATINFPGAGNVRFSKTHETEKMIGDIGHRLVADTGLAVKKFNDDATRPFSAPTPPSSSLLPISAGAPIVAPSPFDSAMQGDRRSLIQRASDAVSVATPVGGTHGVIGSIVGVSTLGLGIPGTGTGSSPAEGFNAFQKKPLPPIENLYSLATQEPTEAHFKAVADEAANRAASYQMNGNGEAVDQYGHVVTSPAMAAGKLASKGWDNLSPEEKKQFHALMSNASNARVALDNPAPIAPEDKSGVGGTIAQQFAEGGLNTARMLVPETDPVQSQQRQQLESTNAAQYPLTSKVANFAGGVVDPIARIAAGELGGATAPLIGKETGVLAAARDAGAVGVAKDLGRSAVNNAIFGAGASVAQQAQQGHIDTGEVLKDAAVTGAQGAAFHGTFGAGMEAIHRLSPSAEQQALAGRLASQYPDLKGNELHVLAAEMLKQPTEKPDAQTTSPTAAVPPADKSPTPTVKENPNAQDKGDGEDGGRVHSPAEERKLEAGDNVAKPGQEVGQGVGGVVGEKGEPPGEKPRNVGVSGPAPGFIRMYHGGREYEGGSRWITPHLMQAQGYADKGGTFVHYVDVPESDSHLKPAYDDTGTDQKAPPVAFDAPPEIAKNLKPLPARNPNIPDWANDEMLRQGKNPNRLLNDIDAIRPKTADQLANDPVTKWAEKNEPALAARMKRGDLSATEYADALKKSNQEIPHVPNEEAKSTGPRAATKGEEAKAQAEVNPDTPIYKKAQAKLGDPSTTDRQKSYWQKIADKEVEKFGKNEAKANRSLAAQKTQRAGAISNRPKSASDMLLSQGKSDGLFPSDDELSGDERAAIHPDAAKNLTPSQRQAARGAVNEDRYSNATANMNAEQRAKYDRVQEDRLTQTKAQQTAEAIGHYKEHPDPNMRMLAVQAEAEKTGAKQTVSPSTFNNGDKFSIGERPFRVEVDADGNMSFHDDDVTIPHADTLGDFKVDKKSIERAPEADIGGDFAPDDKNAPAPTELAAPSRNPENVTVHRRVRGADNDAVVSETATIHRQNLALPLSQANFERWLRREGLAEDEIGGELQELDKGRPTDLYKEWRASIEKSIAKTTAPQQSHLAEGDTEAARKPMTGAQKGMLGTSDEPSPTVGKQEAMFGRLGGGPRGQNELEAKGNNIGQAEKDNETGDLLANIGQTPISEGPGAAASKDRNFREQTSLSTLTDRVAAQAKPSDPIVSRMKGAADYVAGKIGTTKDSIANGLASLRGGMAALYDAYKRTPEDNDYTKITGKWSGADQRSAVDIENFKKSTLKQVPDKLDRGAIGIYMEAGGDKDTLAKWAKDISENPKTKKYADLFDRATKLSDAHQNIANDTQLHNQATLEEAQRAGMLKDGVDNYLMHVWKNNPGELRKIAAEHNFNSLITKPGFTKQRTIPTYFDGIMKGMHPQDLDFASLTAAHERSFREALAARAYIKGLSEAKAPDGRPIATISNASAKEIEGKSDSAYLIKPNMKAQDPAADYRVVDHPALRGWRWAATVDGKPIFVQGDMLVHPDFYNKIHNNLTKSAIQNYELSMGGLKIKPGAAALRVGQEIKSAILSFSMFHQTTLGIHALEHKTKPGFIPELDLNDPVQGKLVDHGLMVAHYDGQSAFSEGVASGGLITKIPLIGPVYHAYTDYLFKSYLPRLKMAMAQNALERNVERYMGQLTDGQIHTLTANQANAAFGGLNYRMLGRNKTFQDVLRMTLMAPDFLEARGRFVGQAVKPYGREQALAITLGAAGMYVGARVLNAMLNDGDPKWSNPFSVVHGGKEYSLRTVQGDILSAITDPKAFIRNRLSPLTGATVSALSPPDRFASKTTPSIDDRLKSAGRSLAPIPVQPFLNGGTDTNAEKAVQGILKIVGINEKNTQPPKTTASPLATSTDPVDKAIRKVNAQRFAPKTPEEKARTSAIEANAQLRREKNTPEAEKQFAQAVKDGTLKPSDKNEILSRTYYKSELEYKVSKMKAEDALSVLEAATPQQKKELSSNVKSKIENINDESRRSALLKRFAELAKSE